MAKMTSSEAFVETLAAEGVTEIFGLVGSAFMVALDIFPLAGIRFVSVQHEQSAAHMADGYSRVTGRHGVCTGQNGPGITNFVTAIAAAYWAHSPVVMITPEAGSLTAGLGGFQETEQMAIFSKITKYQVHVNAPSRIPELTHNAFTIAMHERGPVQVNIPRDYLYADLDVEIPQPRRFERSAGGSGSLDQAAQMLASARSPLILSGGGVVVSGGVEEVKKLAEYLSAPVVTSYLHNDAFPASHELMCGPLGYMGSKAAMKLISQADVVLALGTRLGPFGTLPQYGFDYWPEKAKIIQVDIDSRVLGLVKKVAVPVLGDAKLAAGEILQRLKAESGEGKRDSARVREIAQEKEQWAKELKELSGPSGEEAGLISPRHALSELAKALPKDAIVTTDIGNVCSVANSYLEFEKPGTFLAAMSFGNCGYAFPAAMGAKIGRPDRPVVAYVGDGAWGMSMAEVMTCVREKIPVTAVVFNNRQWGAEKKNQIDFFGDRFIGTNLENPNFAEVAKAMGGEGITVDHPDQVGDALRTATGSDRPTIINVMLTRELGEPFRRDALKKPVYELEKYQPNSVLA